MKRITKKAVRWTLVVSLGALIITGLVFLVWALYTPPVGQLASGALQGTDTVTVDEENGVRFRPANPNGVGLILYPGGRVSPASYAYAAHRIAEEGYTVVVPQLRLNLAVFDIRAAARVIDKNPEVTCWVVGGHSLGGAMAAEYAKNDAIAGLVLWAAYPADSNDLSQSGLLVTSLYGTRDSLTTVDKITNSKQNLPANTTFVTIEGGNHAQFGDYGVQPGDTPATISLQDQQTYISEATIHFLKQPDLCNGRP